MIVYVPGVSALVLLTVTLLKFPCPVRLVIVPEAVLTVTVAFGGTGGTKLPAVSVPLTLKLVVPWLMV